MNAESAKAYAEANKIKGADTDKVRQDIAESEARIDEMEIRIRVYWKLCKRKNNQLHK